jgi:hypothetical protein
VILTPDRRLRVFVSSTLQELAEERLAAQKAVSDLRLTPDGTRCKNFAAPQTDNHEYRPALGPPVPGGSVTIPVRHLGQAGGHVPLGREADVRPDPWDDDRASDAHRHSVSNQATP